MSAMSRRGFGLGLAAVSFARGAGAAVPSPFDPFAVYYGHVDRPGLDRFALLVLDPDADPAILARHKGRATCLAYLSLAEIHEGRPYAASVREEGLLLPGAAAWEGARFVDLRDPRWQRRVAGGIMPGLLARGFHGLFLDTLDTAAALEAHDPARHAGMRMGAVALVRAVREAAGTAPVMVNRGYDLLPELAGSFDLLLGESVRATFEPGSGRFRRVAEADIAWQRDRMLDAKARNLRLTLFSLDYWDPADRDGIARLASEERRDGFIPCISTPDLAIVPEPA